MPGHAPTGGLAGSANDPALDEPGSRPARILQRVPRLLSSKPHVILLAGLGYLIVLPLSRGAA